jgi:phosphoribosylaminoimidazolecarboxamide formyltransferase/IMP cyclohydrolase
MKRRALISVYNKDGIADFARSLADCGWEILSTGGTARSLKEQGLPVTDVSAVTGFPECLDGRVKTLHPAIHAGLLARRDNPSHVETLKKLNIEPIDLVVVNLYPFFEKVQEGLTLDETVEFIDIGGPTMLRSAAKNFHDVIVITDPADYAEILDFIRQDNGSTQSVPLATRKRLAGKVFDLTSAYDAAIARYLLEIDNAAGVPAYPQYWPMSLKLGQALRYGENGHQSAALYLDADKVGALGGMKQLHGKELSYNNIRDLDLAWKAACAFGSKALHTPAIGEDDLARLGLPAQNSDLICCAAIKHNTPCGIAMAKTPLEAFEKAFACDPVSIFGGIIAFTGTVDGPTAEKLHEIFFEIVIAPAYTDEAMTILTTKKKNLRIMRAAVTPGPGKECIAVSGGLLVQDADRRFADKWEVVTKAAPEERDIPDLIFGMRAVHWAKSNAVLVVKGLAASGIGCGQTNRIWAAEQALTRSAEKLAAAKASGTPAEWADGAPARVMASDAFFPFGDCVEAAAKGGIKAIIQPGGSIRDQESIDACDKLGISMVFTGLRHFKH